MLVAISSGTASTVTFCPECRIPSHLLPRVIRRVADEAPQALDAQWLYSEDGRPSIPTEQLLRALLVQAFYTICSER
jgi:transposase